MGLRTRPLSNSEPSTIRSPDVVQQDVTPLQDETGETSGVAPNFGVNFNSDDAAVNEGDVNEFSFVEFLHSSQDLFNSEESGIAELLAEGTGDDLDVEEVDSPSEVEMQAAQDSEHVPGLVGDGDSKSDHARTIHEISLSDVATIDMNACVSTAMMSLPFAAPKPIWEEGVWAAIFGDGILLKPEFCSADFHKPSFEPCLDEWLGQLVDCSRKLKRALPRSTDDDFTDIVKHIPEQTWQEERESLFQTAIKRWMVVVISFNETTTVWKQLAAEQDDVGKVTVLSDLFQGQGTCYALKASQGN